MDQVSIVIDGREILTAGEKTILSAALDAGIYIPHLCSHPDLEPYAACRLCIVEIEGIEKLVPSCVTKVKDKMRIKTKTERILRLRRLALELILTNHPSDCSSCPKYLKCELQSVSQYLGVTVGQNRFRKRMKTHPQHLSNNLFIHDPTRCILCGRCVRACQYISECYILSFLERGHSTLVGVKNADNFLDAGCTFCGSCVEVCPTGALRDHDEAIKSQERKEAAIVPCKAKCPASVDVPTYVRYIKQGDLKKALETIRESAPFASVLGYICNSPCETECRRGRISDPLAIRLLKKYVSENDVTKGDIDVYSPSGKRVAIVGGGPTGLTAAFYLKRKGHDVTVFESLPFLGGMLATGVPDFRLPRSVLEKDLSYILSTGFTVKTSTYINDVYQLLGDDFDAVLVAVGAQKGLKVEVPGASLRNVFIGIDFLREVNLGKRVELGEATAIVGGGNVAIDCARMSRRLGCTKVYLFCLETEEKMPAAKDEVEEAKREGIVFFPSTCLNKIIGNEVVEGLEVSLVESFTFNPDGKVEITRVPGSERFVSVKSVIFAVGQKPVLPLSTDLLSKETVVTNAKGIFVAGDCITGTTFVVNAIGWGKMAAKEIDRYLGGDGTIENQKESQKYLKRLGKIEGFAFKKRVLGPFYTEEKAIFEAQRCLQCDLRLTITPVKFWVDYEIK